jgi:hypothetical protein
VPIVPPSEHDEPAAQRQQAAARRLRAVETTDGEQGQASSSR